MRSENEIKELINLLKKDMETLRRNHSNWHDENVPLEMIRENQYRVHTLEWVLGKHERFD